MFPLEAVTEDEKVLIENYISDNAEEPMQVSVDYFLREWNAKKQDIFDLFGQELILSKEVSFDKSVEQIEEEMDRAWKPENVRNFERKFRCFCNARRQDLWEHRVYDTAEEVMWYDIESLLDYHVLSSNRVGKDFTILLPKPDGTTRRYRVMEDSKPMRVIGKVLQAFNDEDEEMGTQEEFKSYCVWQSQFLNSKKICGDLCISIHPFDYITMSHNNNDWSSCMNWPEDGCYKGGTIEMMNSPMVIVAYLKSHNETLDFEYWYRGKRIKSTWNSKKWRTLIVLNNTGIYSVKSYPYAHEELTKASMEFVKSLIKDREFENVVEWRPYREISLFDFPMRINPRTNRMYNDFGACRHYAYFDANYISELKEQYDFERQTMDIHFNYSGASECVSCGELDTFGDRLFEGEGFLCCIRCYREQNEEACFLCGSLWPQDDLIYVEDELVCPDCLNEECFEDVLTHEYHFNDDGIELSVVRKDTNKKQKIGMIHRYDVEFYLKPEIFKKIKDFNELYKITIKEEDFSEKGEEVWNREIILPEKWRLTHSFYNNWS